MSIAIPPCAFCGKDQKQKGALLFSPPDNSKISLKGSVDIVEKHHICKNCYDDIIRDAILK